MEYVIEIYKKKDSHPFETLILNKRNLQEAINSVQADSEILVNKIYHDGKEVYTSAWDELGILPVAIINQT